VRGLSLTDFILKPISRICKYPLLIRELRRQTKDNSPDRAALQKAEVHMIALTTHICAVREAMQI